MAFDGNCGQMTLHGGADQGWTNNFSDAWAWNGTAWSQLGGTTPAARHGASIAHDAQRGRFVLFGGRSGSGFSADTWERDASCSRTMTTVAPAVVGQTAQFRYDYPGSAANLHFCWTLVTPRQPAAFAVPIPGFPSIGLCRVDLFNVLLDPAQFLDGSGALVTAVPIPNNPAFSGYQFDVQSVDLDFFTLALRWAETDVEVTVGQPGPQPNPALNMVAIAPGTFLMGSTAGLADEQPVHPVSLTQPFWMGKFEVTQAQYQSVMGNNPSYFQGANAPNALQRPVDSVSWNSAAAFCQALTAIEQAAGRVPTGYQYRLPTEAEWEYCCRAGTTTEWSTGVSLTTSEANFGGALASASYPFGQTSVVGSYAPNGFGLHDMHGNVLEWCLDAYAAYAPGPASDPLANVGLDRVYRGGGWETDFSVFMCRSSFRYNTTGATPGFSNEYFGFRIVLAPIRFAAPNPLLNMVPIAPGTFQMGSTAGQSNEQPVHQVTLTQPFWMGKYEVKQAEYQSVVGSNPSSFQGANAPNAPQRPVERVSWNSAVAYCQALTATEQAAGRVPAGYQYRLPTEAEWEYCCRAGTTTEWHTGTSLSTSQANFQGALANGTFPNGQTAVVGSYAPNQFGLHDMHGNVLEWCLDSYALYAPGSVTDPFVTGGADRVIRGGSWQSSFTATFCRSAYRYGFSPGFSSGDVGFRVVLAPVLVP
jgi:formylglycine-generating enzyme required for sulfatase activity